MCVSWEKIEYLFALFFTFNNDTTFKAKHQRMTHYIIHKIIVLHLYIITMIFQECVLFSSPYTCYTFLSYG